MGKKSKKITITIPGGYRPTPIKDIHHHLQIVNQGKGIHKPKKGKGSFQRKPKHQRRGWDHAV